MEFEYSCNLYQYYVTAAVAIESLVIELALWIE